MKLSSLLITCSGFGSHYSPNNVLNSLNIFKDNDYSLSERVDAESFLLEVISLYFGLDIKSVPRDRFSVLVSSYRYYGEVDDVLKDCSVELRILMS